MKRSKTGKKVKSLTAEEQFACWCIAQMMRRIDHIVSNEDLSFKQCLNESKKALNPVLPRKHTKPRKTRKRGEKCQLNNK